MSSCADIQQRLLVLFFSCCSGLQESAAWSVKLIFVSFVRLIFQTFVSGSTKCSDSVLYLNLGY